MRVGGGGAGADVYLESLLYEVSFHAVNSRGAIQCPTFRVNSLLVVHRFFWEWPGSRSSDLGAVIVDVKKVVL